MPTLLRTTIVVLLALQSAIARQPDKNEIRQLFSPTNIAFIENKGQITDQYYQPRPDIDFKLDARGVNVFISAGQIHYQWTKAADKDLKTTWTALNSSREYYRMDVELLGSNKNAQVIKEEQQCYSERYYITGDEGLVAHSFQRITYRDIYPNIDWVIYTSKNQLKYDFVVRPGGSVHDIKLKYNGATSLELDKGALVTVTPAGSITEQQPYSYQKEGNVTVSSKYLLNGDELSFDVASYSGTLVIDPQLDWATYYGSTTSENQARFIGRDDGGNVYIGGLMNGGNMATVGAHAVFVPSVPFGVGFIAKFNEAGQRIWATYYGSPTQITAFNEIVTTGNMLYLTGLTGATTGIATPGAHQTARDVLTADALLVKFDTAGVRQWGTYFGGNGDDIGLGITLDAGGNVYICGGTFSNNGLDTIATTGAHQATLQGTGMNGFLAKFNSSGVQQWGTYYGGEYTAVASLDCDAAGYIYIAGSTSGTTGIASVGAHQPVFGGGSVGGSFGSGDAFLAKFNSNGVRVWGTYYGGAGDDGMFRGFIISAPIQNNHVACDQFGNVYLAGPTSSTSGIATAGTHQTAYNGSIDLFLVKFDTNGNRKWGTYYGGADQEDMACIAISPNNKSIYFGGRTLSTSDIATPGTHQPAHDPNSFMDDAFIAIMDSAGQRLAATYYGGPAADYLTGIVSGGSDTFYVAGIDYGSGNLTTPGSFQPNLSGNEDMLLAKFYLPSFSISPVFQDTSFCKGESFQLPYSTGTSFNAGNSFTVLLSNAAGSFASPVNIGSATATISGTINCTIPINTTTGTGYRLRIVASSPATISAPTVST